MLAMVLVMFGSRMRNAMVSCDTAAYIQIVHIMHNMETIHNMQNKHTNRP